jgi:hypothetical protein
MNTKKVPTAVKWISAYLIFSGIINLLFYSSFNNLFLLIVNIIFAAICVILGINILRLLGWARVVTLVLLYCIIFRNILTISFNSAYDFGYTFAPALVSSIIPMIIIRYLLKNKKLSKIKVNISKNKHKFSSKWYFWAIMIIGGILLAVIIAALLIGMGSIAN